MASSGRVLSVVALGALLAGLWLFLAPPALGGQLTAVTTYGTSMKPSFSAGDLAVVHRQNGYVRGDVVAYHSKVLGRVVMHRIVGVDQGGFVFKGDNNDYLDPDRPDSAQCIGKLVLRIPQGGHWLDLATNPVVLSALAATLMAAVGGGVNARNRRRRRMSRHAVAPRRSSSAWMATPDNLRGVWATVLAALVVGGSAGALAWTTAPTTMTTRSQPATSSAVFSYSAQVPRSAAYQTTVVTAPDPVFRRVSNRVRVAYHYQGAPGQVQVDAIVRASSGWHTTVPLSGPVAVAQSEYSGSVTLNLDALEAQAQLAAAVIGVPAGQLTVTVAPSFTSTGQERFGPELTFTMTESRFALAGGASTLKVVKTTALPTSVRTPRTLHVGPVAVSVAQARYASLALTAIGLLVACFLAVAARRWRGIEEGALIRRKYAHLLVDVEPSSTVAGRPLVDVTRFATLTKVAERYGLLILHWSRSGVDTYLVQDQSATYRYRVGNVDDADDVGAGLALSRSR
jgi:signal peptidase I